MSLNIPRSRVSTMAYDAGDYVCNFSMWLAETFADANGRRAGFLHIPRDFGEVHGRAYLKWLLDELRAARGDL